MAATFSAFDDAHTPKASMPIIGAAALLDEWPKAQWLLADRGHDADWFRDALQERVSSHAFQAGNRVTSLSNTTSAATGGAAASRSCSAV